MLDKNSFIVKAKRCIGLDRRRPYTRHGKKFYRSYRNYYATGKEHDDWESVGRDEE